MYPPRADARGASPTRAPLTPQPPRRALTRCVPSFTTKPDLRRPRGASQHLTRLPSPRSFAAHIAAAPADPGAPLCGHAAAASQQRGPARTNPALLGRVNCDAGSTTPPVTSAHGSTSLVPPVSSPSLFTLSRTSAVGRGALVSAPRAGTRSSSQPLSTLPRPCKCQRLRALCALPPPMRACLQSASLAMRACLQSASLPFLANIARARPYK